ncbi:hypothetical protein CL620_06310 [archaeon]|jgi:hypothetical protein|nr:hypothetical protein [archaeon]|tara:strand:- start:1558 stop:1878 length:321 start_codon:yes stop_codon:yes gene_type:complete
MSERTVYVGNCGVDSGQIVLIDPCYAFDDDFKAGETPTGGNYDHICRRSLYTDDKCGPVGLPGSGYNNDLGVVVSTGYGDGSYPVHAKITSDNRIASVTIQFISED